MSTISLDWEKLLSPARYGLENENHSIYSDTEFETAFQGDAKRILYSSAFRRLQGKAQVHSLPTYDYLRTRLTHTIEVANLGGSIGAEIAKKLVISGKLEKELATHVGDIVYAACLAHDIGNPPFGHSGEQAIQTWFQRKLEEKNTFVLAAMETDEKKKDFLCFDGNAQGFRVITRLSNWKNDGGARLTHAVLGAFSKYPHSSALCHEKDKNKKKFGYMYHDREAAESIFSSLGLNKNGDGDYHRHPLVYIVEAADDISYLTTDIEDAHRIRCLDFEEAMRLLKPIADSGNSMQRYESMKHSDNFDAQDKIGYLRASAIRTLTIEFIKKFIDQYDNIMTGRLGNKGLLEVIPLSHLINDIKEKCNNKIYIEERKMQTETAGYNVIMGLMDLYGDMILQYLKEKQVKEMDSKNRAIYNLLPKEYQKRLEELNAYSSFLVLIDYISGMTDRFAMDLFQRLTGTSVAIGRMA